MEIAATVLVLSFSSTFMADAVFTTNQNILHLTGSCKEPSGRIHRHGVVWQREPCIRCTCLHGHVRCLQIKCTWHLKCRDGEIIYSDRDECCPKCIQSKGICKYEGKYFKNGSVWKPSSNTVCRCDDGMFACQQLHGKIASKPEVIPADQPSESTLSSETGYSLTVMSGEPAIISTNFLSFKNSAKDESNILFIIGKKLKTPEEGRLMLAGFPHLEVISFTQRDLITERLVYIPPSHVIEETAFNFTISVWKYPERIKLTGEHTFYIKVSPPIKEEWKFEIQNPVFNVTKGESVTVAVDYFNIKPRDKNLEYIITKAPQSGILSFLFRNGSSFHMSEGYEFNKDDLNAALVLYEHDGRNTYEDSFEVIATDMKNEAINFYQFSVIPETEICRQKSETIEIFEGEEIPISSDHFILSDLDLIKNHYKLVSLPIYGKLFLVEDDGHEFFIDELTTISKENIDKRELHYKGMNEIGPNAMTDNLKFSSKIDGGATDRNCNEVEIQIMILPVDNQPPNLTVNGKIVVNEGSTLTLPASLLTTIDVDTCVEDLQVEIVTQPYFGDIKILKEGSKSEAITRFSISDLQSEKVIYDQKYHKKVEPIEDAILIRVTDGKQSSPIARINVSIQLQNDEPPEVLTIPLQVKSGETKVVSIDNLYVNDMDTEAANIVITFVSIPHQGVLRKLSSRRRRLGRGKIIRVNDTLTNLEIIDGLLTYTAYRGTDETEDIFTFQASDGEFTVHGSLPVSISHDIASTEEPKRMNTSPNQSLPNVKTENHMTSTSRILESRATELIFDIQYRSNASFVLPYRPHLTAQMGFTDPRGDTGLSPGSPLACIPPCHPQHPFYSTTQDLCHAARFSLDSINFSWEISMPIDEECKSYLPYEQITYSTIFSDAHSKLLDPMYFARCFRVRCVVSKEGGIFMRSNNVTINGGSYCTSHSKKTSDQPFSATISYVNSSYDGRYASKLNVKLIIPHNDGMVPLVSTHPLDDFEILLPKGSPFRSHHLCSNLNYGQGFLEFPGIHSSELLMMYADNKENKGSLIPLYKLLDLENCQWHFEGWFGMGELIENCGGKVASDSQVSMSGQSHLNVQVPLYVSQVHTSGPSRWKATQYKTTMDLTMQYSSLLWGKGFHLDPPSYARLQIIRIMADESGRLIVDIMTESLFQGHFVYEETGLSPQILPPPHLKLLLNLTLEQLRAHPTPSDTTEQIWRVKSNMALEDYSGKYTIRLIPCIKDPMIDSGHPDKKNKCTTGNPVDLTFNVKFKQIQRPQAAKYSLATEFYLKKQLPDLHNARIDKEIQGIEANSETYFPGDEVYGLVMWHRAQDLSKAYHLSIQRLYLCNGRNGYVPVYDPTGEIFGKGPQYGCMQPSKMLKHQFLLLDNYGHKTSIKDSNNVNFEIQLAKENAKFNEILTHSGVDGFVMKADPLFELNAGTDWYIQVFYTISKSHERSKRSLVSHDGRKEIENFMGSELQNWTNIRGLTLDTKNTILRGKEEIFMFLIVAGVLTTLFFIVYIPFKKKRRASARLGRNNSSNSENIEITEQVEPLNYKSNSENIINDLYQGNSISLAKCSEEGT